MPKKSSQPRKQAKKATKKAAKKSAKTAQSVVNPMEQMMLEKLGGDHAALAEMKSALSELMDAVDLAGGPEALGAIDWSAMPGGIDDEDRLYDANELVYDAQDAPTLKKRIKLAREALDTHPECADAWLILAHSLDLSAAEYECYVMRAINAGRVIIGDDFDDFRGEFWGFMETRPFMRGLAALGEFYFTEGNLSAAIDTWEEMLELNPNDNQGVRDSLGAAYLMVEDLDAARALLDRYPQDMAAWLYGNALELFLRHGAGKKADAALKKALKNNPHCAEFFTGAYQLPDEMPGMYSPGSLQEAEILAQHTQALWLGNQEAVSWLKRVRGKSS
ncbi:hypothetical protein [Cerasicoccus frondis]|uniref:hypothetical protein n=1 Tax=Cerasicoccus frondis TaxID=490090 RepID=UPI002852B1AE|nr:hypothetical protein [Cerasicoccus frondis]